MASPRSSASTARLHRRRGQARLAARGRRRRRRPHPQRRRRGAVPLRERHRGHGHPQRACARAARADAPAGRGAGLGRQAPGRPLRAAAGHARGRRETGAARRGRLELCARAVRRRRPSRRVGLVLRLGMLLVQRGRGGARAPAAAGFMESAPAPLAQQAASSRARRRPTPSLPPPETAPLPGEKDNTGDPAGESSRTTQCPTRARVASAAGARAGSTNRSSNVTADRENIPTDSLTTQQTRKLTAKPAAAAATTRWRRLIPMADLRVIPPFAPTLAWWWSPDRTAPRARRPGRAARRRRGTR